MPDPNINNDFIPHPYIDRGVISVSGKLFNPRIKNKFLVRKIKSWVYKYSDVSRI